VSDKVGVQRADPCLYLSLSFLLGGALQSMLARGQPRENPEAKVGLALSAAASCTVAYLAVLWVMRSEPVAAVAPVRSLAVVLSVFVGSRLLGEEAGPVRYFGAGTILTGIVLVSIG
ncbi:MAG: DMT family transporter, partial [Fimbriimonadales bacterium]